MLIEPLKCFLQFIEAIFDLEAKDGPRMMYSEYILCHLIVLILVQLQNPLPHESTLREEVTRYNEALRGIKCKIIVV